MSTSSRTSRIPRKIPGRNAKGYADYDPSYIRAWPDKISAKRNILKKITIQNAEGWMRINNSIKERMPEWDAVPSIIYSKNEILHYIDEWNRKKEYTYAILDKKTGRMIGDFHIKSISHKKMNAEFGHALDPSVWGTGRTYETIRAVHNAAKKRGLKLWCKIEDRNIRSWKSIEKYGAAYKGKRAFNKNGKRITVRKYELW